MFSRFKCCSAGWKVYLATTITFSLFIHPARAETASADTEPVGKLITATNLQEVTVTATRTSRKVSEIPESVSVVDTEQIRTRQAADIGDLLRYLPNIDLGGGPRNLGISPTIRGMADDRILFLLDGARQDFQPGA
ncbi:MAG: TonB-dependent receptor plug domain-containing protein [Nitrosomonas sp.]|nr:TonB-dependent receptor plug domain-containing protein [Nitrosomonas sp.]